MRPKSLITGAGIICLALFQALPAGAQAQDDTTIQKYFGPGRRVEFGLRTLGGHTLLRHKENELYKSGLKPAGLDLLLKSENPSFSWRISLENLHGFGGASSEYYIDADNYGRTENDYHLSVGGLIGAFVYHSPAHKKIRFYGGLGLGFYSAREDCTIDVYDVVSTVSSTGITNSQYRGRQFSLNAFFGVNYRLSEDASLGLECVTRWLNINMADVADDYAKNLSGYGWYLVFNLRPL